MQVSIYLADKDHPAYGYVRAFVKDSNDVTSELSFLDSDGQVNSNEPRAGLPEHGGEHACAVPGARHARPGLSCAGGEHGRRPSTQRRLQPRRCCVLPTQT